ncbi:hypothetical protein ACFLIM_25170 [Nonomuraea sp. M3C6]|uniref:Uncharacterized protein n=1 Tax=Nonomuraea marmarensis TaxID=3351344 RepID=A0ABW7AGJ9_9ACTN
MKDAIAALGIPRRAIRAVTDLGATHATVLDHAHVALIAEHADQLATSGAGIGVVLWQLPCGCTRSVRLTTDIRHAGRVDTIPVTPFNEHYCPTPPKDDAVRQHIDAQEAQNHAKERQ